MPDPGLKWYRRMRDSRPSTWAMENLQDRIGSGFTPTTLTPNGDRR